MKRALLVAIIISACLALAPEAQAKRANYRPWKAALQRAFDTYVDEYWRPRCNLDVVSSLTNPPGFEPRQNTWDFETEAMACEVMAFWGVFPNGEWGPEVRAFLRPFLGTKSIDGKPYMTSWAVPIPWIVDLRPAWMQ